MAIGGLLGAFGQGVQAGQGMLGRGILFGNTQPLLKMNIGQDQAPTPQGTVPEPSLAKPSGDKPGRMNPNEAYGIVKDEVIKQGLVGTVPKDGEKYGIKTGSADEWANFYTRLAYHESGLKNGTVGDVGRFNGGSRGLFQLSYDDARNYKLNGGKAFTSEQLADPRQNTAAAITISKTLIDKHGGIGSGMGRYWGPISKEGWTPGRGRDANIAFSVEPAPSPAGTASGPPVPVPRPRGLLPFSSTTEATSEEPPRWGLLQQIMNSTGA